MANLRTKPILSRIHQRNRRTVMSSSTAVKRDHRQEVTDGIISMLEEGTSPWQKPWTAGALEMPFNPITGKLYRGGRRPFVGGGFSLQLRRSALDDIQAGATAWIAGEER